MVVLMEFCCFILYELSLNNKRNTGWSILLTGPAPGGFFSPLRFEADVFDCEVEGQVPQDLNGAFYRVGGEWFYPPSYPDDIPLSTDGYISMFGSTTG